jgi:hypothetical protein
MATKKKISKKSKKSQKPANRKSPAKHPAKRRNAPKKLVKKKTATKKAVARKKAVVKKRPLVKKKAVIKKKTARTSRETQKKTSTKSRPARRGPRSFGSTHGSSDIQSGDFQGLANVERADSESVKELLDEGNAYEAGIVSGVEDADAHDEQEVHTREVPEDDVPGEYLDED